MHNQDGHGVAGAAFSTATNIQDEDREETIQVVMPDACRGDDEQQEMSRPMDYSDDEPEFVRVSENRFFDGLNVRGKKKSGPHLYNLMHITSDKQDLSFVEKVMLPQAKIFDLCNQLVSNFARLLGHEN